MDRSLWPKMAEVSNGAFFCTTELSTQGKMKWTLKLCHLVNDLIPNSQGHGSNTAFANEMNYANFITEE